MNVANDVANELQSVRGELDEARSEHAAFFDARGDDSPEIADVVRLHCERLESIDSRLQDVCSGLARSTSGPKPNISRALDEVRYMRNSPKLSEQERSISLDRIDAMLRGIAI